MEPEVVNTIVNVTRLISFIALIIVLVRLFQRKGVLHGILGIITLGIYPFIWGWVKVKVEKLTWVMIAWTLAMLVYFYMVAALVSQITNGL